MKRLTILLVMAIAASGGGCGGSSQTRLASPTPMPKHSMARVDELPQRLQIPLQNHDKHLFVRTTLEGTDGGLFLLDTGAAINAIGCVIHTIRGFAANCTMGQSSRSCQGILPRNTRRL